MGIILLKKLASKTPQKSVASPPKFQNLPHRTQVDFRVVIPLTQLPEILDPLA